MGNGDVLNSLCVIPFLLCFKLQSTGKLMEEGFHVCHIIEIGKFH